MPCVSIMDINFSVCALMLKINFFTASIECDIIHINANNITI